MATIKAAQVKELRDKIGVGMMDAKKALVETDGDMDAAIDLLREKGVAKAEKKANRIAAEGLSDIVTIDNRSAIVEINSETDFVAKNEQFITLVKNIATAMATENPSSMEEALEAEIDGVSVGEAVTNATSTIGEKITFRRFAVMEAGSDEIVGNYVHMGGRIAVLVKLAGGDEEVARNIAMHVAAINPQYLDREQVPQVVREHEVSVLTEQAKNEGKPDHIVEKMVEGRVNKWLAEISLVDQSYVKDGDITVGEYAKNHGAQILEFVRFEVGEGLEKRNDDFAEEVRSQMK